MKYLAAALRLFFLEVLDATPTVDAQADIIRECVAGCGLDKAWKVVGDSERSAKLSSAQEKKGRMKEVDA